MEAIPQAADVSVRESGEEGINRANFRICTEAEGTEDGEDIRETIFFAFADQRIPILSMKTIRASLEEVFLELTGEGTAEGIETSESLETDDFEWEPSEADLKEEKEDGEGDEE